MLIIKEGTVIMTGEERRAAIMAMLDGRNQPLSAGNIAKEFDVTRQIIVSDIAILRASGARIRAEHRGYVLEGATSAGIVRRIVCRHNEDNLLDELYAVVDNGGVVVDVSVEHGLYGEITAHLGIASRYDADEFAKKCRASSSVQLASLTGGVHMHNISLPSDDCYNRIVNALAEKGILVTG